MFTVLMESVPIVNTKVSANLIVPLQNVVTGCANFQKPPQIASSQIAKSVILIQFAKYLNSLGFVQIVSCPRVERALQGFAQQENIQERVPWIVPGLVAMMVFAVSTNRLGSARTATLVTMMENAIYLNNQDFVTIVCLHFEMILVVPMDYVAR